MARITTFLKLLVGLVPGLFLVLSACMTSRYTVIWPVRELVLTPSPVITLVGPYERSMGTVKRLTMQKFLLAHFRVSKAAGIQAELLLVDGTDPNAFAGTMGGRATIAVNLALLELLQDDEHEFAALVGHEAAHLARGHGATGRTRSNTLNAIGSAVGMGLGAAGVPAGGAIAGVAVDLIDTAYNREEEREADALGVEYAITAGYDPSGALRLQEKLLTAAGGPLIPFLSSHPSGQDRIQNLKALIAAKKSPSATEHGTSIGSEEFIDNRMAPRSKE